MEIAAVIPQRPLCLATEVLVLQIGVNDMLLGTPDTAALVVPDVTLISQDVDGDKDDAVARLSDDGVDEGLLQFLQVARQL